MKTGPPTQKTFYQVQSKYSSRSEAGQAREKHCTSLSLGSDTNVTGPGKASAVVFLSLASGEQHFQVSKAILTLDQQLPHDTKEGIMECKCYTVTSSPRRGDRERVLECIDVKQTPTELKEEADGRDMQGDAGFEQH